MMPYYPPAPPKTEIAEEWPRVYFTHTIPLSRYHMGLLEVPETMTEFEWDNFMRYLSVVKQVVVEEASRDARTTGGGPSDE